MYRVQPFKGLADIIQRASHTLEISNFLATSKTNEVRNKFTLLFINLALNKYLKMSPCA